ncbi:RNA polymerase sigma-70 factor [Rhabdobacter roseus]
MIRVSEGDQEAFSELYLHYKPLLFRFVIKILKSEELAHDTCQEVFIKIWEEPSKLVEIHSFKYYLLTMGKNHSLNLLHKISTEERSLSQLVKHISEQRNEAEDQIQSAEYQKFIQSHLASLPPQSRQVFQLCRQQGLSYGEAARILGLSAHSIKKHMVKSMRIFKVAMERELGITISFCLSVVFRFAVFS